MAIHVLIFLVLPYYLIFACRHQFRVDEMGREQARHAITIY
jgi:hypothetical protein